MPVALPIVLVPGLNCSARLYAEQIPALWRFGSVQVADHTRADSMDAIAADILAHAVASTKFRLCSFQSSFIATARTTWRSERVCGSWLRKLVRRPSCASRRRS
jgi:hypothetical protein